MSRPYQQVSDVPYQSPVPFYYPGNPQQPPSRMQVVDYPYNPDLSYPQVPPAPVNWLLYPRQSQAPNEDLTSPLGNNPKFQYAAHGQSMPMQLPAFQYSAVPYMMQSMAPGMQIPRSSDISNGREHRNQPNVESNTQPHQRSGTALVANLPRATKMELLNPGAPHASVGIMSSSASSSRRTSNSSTKLPNSSMRGSTSSVDLLIKACEVCGKVFQKPYNLKSHMKTHSSDRPFKCLFCPKTFARSHDRKRHENLHGGQKNFKCEGYLRNGITRWGCGKKFARSDALARHFRTETGYLCIKQFMDEEKESESGADSGQDLQYLYSQMHSSHPFYPQQQAQLQAQAQAQPPLQKTQHYQMNSSLRSIDFMSYSPPQILLPPLLRH